MTDDFAEQVSTPYASIVSGVVGVALGAVVYVILGVWSFSPESGPDIVVEIADELGHGSLPMIGLISFLMAIATIVVLVGFVLRTKWGWWGMFVIGVLYAPSAFMLFGAIILMAVLPKNVQLWALGKVALGGKKEKAMSRGSQSLYRPRR